MVKYEYGDTLQFTLKRLKLSSWSGLNAFAEIFDFVQNVSFPQSPTAGKIQKQILNDIIAVFHAYLVQFCI